MVAKGGFEAGLRPLFGCRLLGLPSFWAPKLGTGLEGDRDGDFR